MPTSPEALQSLLAATPVAHFDVAVIATLADGAIGFWNKAAEETYGWSAGEVLGENVAEVTPARLALGQADEIMAQLRRGQSWQGEFPVRRRDGVEFPAFVIDTPLPALGSDGCAIIGASAPVRDAAKVKRRNSLLLYELDRYFGGSATASAKTTAWTGGLSTAEGVYYRCYLLSKQGQFAAVREAYMADDEAALAFAAEELARARRTYDYAAVEVWCGGRLAGRLTS